MAGSATSIILDATKNVFCNDKSMRAPNIFFVATSLLVTKHLFCRNKSMLIASFVATNNFFYDKGFVATKIFCGDKGFVAASILLSRQKTYFATKIILVAAPAKDRGHVASQHVLQSA